MNLSLFRPWLLSLCLSVVTCYGLQPPTFVLGPNDQRFLSTDTGVIYFTTDGTDPRDESNKPSATAKIAETLVVKETILLAEKTPCRVWVPESSIHDNAWLKRSFEDSEWPLVKPPIGYDDEDTYISLIQYDVKESMRGKRGSIYLRWKFDLKDLPLDDEVYLDVRCDDGFAAFLNGKRIASMNAPESLNWQSEADDKVNDSGAVEFRAIQLSEGAKSFKKGGNILAVQALNDGLTSSDFLFSARLRGRSTTGGTVVWDPENPTSLVARSYHDGEWSEATRLEPPRDTSVPHDGKSWAQFLGPNENAVYSGPPLLTDWPEEGPKVVWRHDVGAGHASPVVADDKVIVLHRSGRNFAIDCLHADSGKPIWSKSYPTTFRDKSGYDHGSRGTPTIAGDRVVFSLPDGLFACLAMSDGREVWKHNLYESFDTDATWHGFLASPLVVNDKVILPVGADDAGIVAFSMKDGSPQWKTSGDSVCGVSPRLARFGETDTALVTTRTHVRCLDPTTGKEHWSFPSPGQSSGNPLCASPMIYGDEVLLSGWYGIGLHRVRVTNNQPSLVWNLENMISSHYASVIRHQGYLYGYHGHASKGPTLRCMKLSTRKVIWEEDHGSSGTITQIGDHLLIVTDHGELMLVPINPAKCDINARVQLTRRGTRNYPAIAKGLVYVKGPRRLLCLDLRKD